MQPDIKRSFVNAVRLERDRVPNFEEYPFCIPSIRRLDRLESHPAVPFFIGENGSGKSTLLEAIALKMGYNAEGGGKNFNFSTLATHSYLRDFLRLERGVGHPTDGGFLRAEVRGRAGFEVEGEKEVTRARVTAEVTRRHLTF
jgi:predicted ATPase